MVKENGAKRGQGVGQNLATSKVIVVVAHLAAAGAHAYE
jgi:hypothetical protein